MTDLDLRLAAIRQLSAEYQAGGRGAAEAFRGLMSDLLHSTVLEEGEALSMVRGDRADSWVVCSAHGPAATMQLRNGWHLRASVSLHLDPDSGRLKVSQSAYQYQARADDNRTWLFRYDYLREAGRLRHASAHLNVNGTFTVSEAGPVPSMAKVHFPVWRTPIEVVIRLLAEDFEVPCRDPAEVWQAVLAESERLFREIAHVPIAGPSIAGKV